MTTDKYGFDLETCSRCGGSGKYSYNAIHGDRCYGCGGSGYKYSKVGKAAFDLFTDSLKKNTSQLLIGEKMLNCNIWCEVKNVNNNLDGSTELTVGYKDGYSVTQTFPKLDFRGNEIKWRVAHTGEEKTAKLQAALAYQAKRIAKKQKKVA